MKLLGDAVFIRFPTGQLSELKVFHWTNPISFSIVLESPTDNDSAFDQFLREEVCHIADEISNFLANDKYLLLGLRNSAPERLTYIVESCFDKLSRKKKRGAVRAVYGYLARRVLKSSPASTFGAVGLASGKLTKECPLRKEALGVRYKLSSWKRQLQPTSQTLEKEYQLSASAILTEAGAVIWRFQYCNGRWGQVETSYRPNQLLRAIQSQIVKSNYFTLDAIAATLGVDRERLEHELEAYIKLQLIDICFPTESPLESRNIVAETDAEKTSMAVAVAKQHDIVAEPNIIDAYAVAIQSIPPSTLDVVKEAIQTYTSIGRFTPDATPLTQAAELFRGRLANEWGCETPIPLSEAYFRFWTGTREVLDRSMPISKLTSWPDPEGANCAYRSFFSQLNLISKPLNLADCSMVSEDILLPKPSTNFTSCNNYCNVFDAVFRVDTSLPMSVLVETCTTPGRLTQRHWPEVTRTDTESRFTIEAYLEEYKNSLLSTLGDAELIEVVSSPPEPLLEFLDQRTELFTCSISNNTLLLAGKSTDSKCMRFEDLQIVLEKNTRRLIIKHKDRHSPIHLMYHSPVSPKYDSRLYFLRFLALAQSAIFVAPKLLPVLSDSSYSPAVHIDRLVLHPRRWIFAATMLTSIINAKSRKSKYHGINRLREDYSVPNIIYAFTRLSPKPHVVDLRGPIGFEILISMIDKLQSNDHVFFEDSYPSIGRSLIKDGAAMVATFAMSDVAGKSRCTF